MEATTVTSVVFVPGFMQRGEAWRPVAERLGTSYRSVPLDHRAHTLSGRLDEVVGELSPKVALVGYSMGAFLGTIVAAREPVIRAVVLAAGGDLPTTVPFGPLVRSVVDPTRSVRKLAGRPLLMIHGRRDRTILPEQAERLYAAAGEPKEIRWYDAGHWLPAPAIDGAAEWLAGKLEARVRRAGASG